MAGERRQAAVEQHADRGLRAHSAVVGISGLGMGNRRQRAGLVVPEAVWIGVRAQWTYSPGDAEGGRARNFSHRHVDRLSTARPWHCALSRPDEGVGRSIAEVLGLSRMSFRTIDSPIAITDLPLESETTVAAMKDVSVDNFSFAPAAASVPLGGSVRWTNRDDVPHVIMSSDKKFKSPVLDTDQQFSFTFDAPGNYEYFCSLHPKMTGRVSVG